MPAGFTFAESERVGRGAAAAFRVHQFGHERRAVLFSADAGRIRYQWNSGAGELSGLPVSGTESFAGAGEFRALDLGALRRKGRSGPGASCPVAERHRIQPPAPQLRCWVHLARRRLPMVSIMFAWGGPEGHHNLFNMNPSLLGGSARRAGLTA